MRDQGEEAPRDVRIEYLANYKVCIAYLGHVLMIVHHNIFADGESCLMASKRICIHWHGVGIFYRN